MTKTTATLSLPAALVFFVAAGCGPTVVTPQGQAPSEPDDGMTPVAAAGEDGPAYEGEEDAPVAGEFDDADDPLPTGDDADPSLGDDDPGATAQALSTSATCTSTAHTGDYCGGDKVSNANPDTLYRCNGPGTATVIRSCSNGCHVAPAGQDDYCNAPPPPTCDGDAHTGAYCGGDKVSHGSASTLYECSGPGAASVLERCSQSCVVAPAGHDDYCADTCAHHSQLKWGLAPSQSDHLRCAGITAAGISQTIGNAAASAGTHAQDGTSGGFAYCAATDLRTAGLTNTQVRALLNRLADEGFAAFFRNPGHDGWPSSEIRHIHAIYVGVHMKSSLRAQVQDWLNGKNGLVSHTTYTFWQASAAQKSRIRAEFNAHN